MSTNSLIYGNDKTNNKIRPVLVDEFGKLQIDITGSDGAATASNQTNGDQLTQILGRTDITDNATKISLKATSTGALHVSHLAGTPQVDNETISIPASGTQNGTSANTSGYNVIGFTGTTTNTVDPIYVQVSTDDVTFYNHSEILLLNGSYAIEFEKPAFQYYRLILTDTTAAPTTITSSVSRR